MERIASLPPIPARPLQFTIRSLLWLMVSLGMILAFVRPADGPYISIALVTGVFGVGWATVVGWKSSRIVESIYWGLLAMSLAVICLAGQAGVARTQRFAWPLVAIVVGAIAGAIRPGALLYKIPATVLVGTILMAVWIRVADTMASDWVDIVLSAAVAAILAVLSDLFAWARTHYRTSYGAWAASLVLAVILGNWGAAWIIENLPRLAGD